MPTVCIQVSTTCNSKEIVAACISVTSKYYNEYSKLILWYDTASDNIDAMWYSNRTVNDCSKIDWLIEGHSSFFPDFTVYQHVDANYISIFKHISINIIFVTIQPRPNFLNSLKVKSSGLVVKILGDKHVGIVCFFTVKFTSLTPCGNQISS